MEKTRNSANVDPKTRRLAYCAAVYGVGRGAGRAASAYRAKPLGSYTLKIGLGVLPVIVTAVLYGPLYGGTVGALTDLLQALIFPKGAYMPWFTVIGALFGVIPGMFFVKGQKPTLKRIFVAVFSGQTVCSVVLNTLLLMWLYGSPWQIVYARLINQAVMIPLYTALVYYVVKLMDKCGII